MSLKVLRSKSWQVVRSSVTVQTRCLSIPSEADVVVIGGGSVGCNTLYHLAKLGVKNAVLLEKDKLTAGTTWHTAGLLWRLRPNDTDIQIINRSRALNTEILKAETGQETGWINNGGLFIASTKTRLDEYKRLMTIGHYFGIESHVLGPQETKKLYPLMNVDDVYGTLYSPGDGLIDPSGVCESLARAAKKYGAQVIEKCAVTGIEIRVDDFGTKRVAAVNTALGRIKTDRVVVCAGAWSDKIGHMAGVNVPLCVMRHAYVISDKIPGIQNMPNVRDHDASVYLRLQGDALAIGGYEPNPMFIDDLSNDFAFSLFDLDWDVFGINMSGALNRVPILENIGIKSEVCGPESFTPDHKPLLGEAPELRGFFLGCGFNSAGMMLGGSGEQLAQWVVHGRPELFMHGYDFRRFAHKLTNKKSWIKDRSHESYAKNYSIVFPHDEPLAGRNQRKDPFFEAQLRDGCVFQERLGWERPAWFSTDNVPSPILDYDYYGYYGLEKHKNYVYDQRLQSDYTFDFPKHHDIIAEECHATRTSLAMFNMSYFGKFFLTGSDAQKAVDWIFSGDMRKPPGSTMYTCMLNNRGGVEADLTVSVIESGDDSVGMPKFGSDQQGFYIAAGGAVAQHVWQHVHTAIQDRRFNVKMVDHSEDMGLLSVQGPKSRELLQSLTQADLSDQSFPFSTQQVISVAGHNCRVLRLSFVGELGFELHIPKQSCMPVYDAITKAGKSHGLRNAGYRAIDALSLEKGYRLWGFDVRNSDTPLEAGLAFTCKLKTDIPFQGRKVLERQKTEGLKQRIAFFTIDEHRPIWGLETVYKDDVPVGFVRRADYAFSLGKSLGVAYLRKPDGSKVTNEWIKSGQNSVEIMGEKLTAQMFVKPLFDPENKRIKGIY